MSGSEAYLDIVWRQFKKNRIAYWCLWPLLALAIAAICAPLLASNVPLWFCNGKTTIYPWFSTLFNPEADQPVDFYFNMALVALVPWMVVALISNVVCLRRGWPGRKRLGLVVLELLALVIAVNVVFSFPQMRPANRYGARDFPEEEFHNPDARAGYVLIPYGPTEQDLTSRLEPPGFTLPASAQYRSNQSAPHLLGTFSEGQDVLARLIYGTRISMSVGIVAVSIYMVLGVIIGAVAGYFGGGTDIFISRIIEIVVLFPSFFLILTIVAMLGRDIMIIMAVIGVTGWTGIARLTRGEVLKQRSLDYTLAAQALGASHGRILFRHILSNSLGPALVSVPFGIASAIITEASLSVLGFGVREPAPSWGGVLNAAIHDYEKWWLIVFPSLAIFFTVAIFNLVGSGLRDAMDPRLRL